jgi:hypothetical protein
MMPALLTSASIPPNAFSVASNMDRMEAGSATSARTADALPPFALIFPTRASAGPALAE